MAAKKYYGYHKDFNTLADAKYASDVDDIDTTGMIWNGECYYDRDEKVEWWPVYEIEQDADGDEQSDIIGYIRGY